MKKYMKRLVTLILLSSTLSIGAQVQRAIIGQSIIRDNILVNSEFDFFRDWNTTAIFKSGIGETVTFYPVTFSIPEKNVKLFGLQVDVLVKSREQNGYYTGASGAIGGAVKTEFIERSIFIDKNDAVGFADYLKNQVVPNLKKKYKKQSKEYIFKSREMFFSFLIDENKARITMHLSDYGPLGNEPGSRQIEFWTEAKIDDIPLLLTKIEAFVDAMK
jgi:hypothetical protein